MIRVFTPLLFWALTSFSLCCKAQEDDGEIVFQVKKKDTVAAAPQPIVYFVSLFRSDGPSIKKYKALTILKDTIVVYSRKEDGNNYNPGQSEIKGLSNYWVSDFCVVGNENDSVSFALHNIPLQKRTSVNFGPSGGRDSVRSRRATPQPDNRFVFSLKRNQYVEGCSSLVYLMNKPYRDYRGDSRVVLVRMEQVKAAGRTFNCYVVLSSMKTRYVVRDGPNPRFKWVESDIEYFIDEKTLVPIRITETCADKKYGFTDRMELTEIIE